MHTGPRGAYEVVIIFGKLFLIAQLFIIVLLVLAGAFLFILLGFNLFDVYEASKPATKIALKTMYLTFSFSLPMSVILSYYFFDFKMPKR